VDRQRILAAIAICLPSISIGAERELVRVDAPGHDPLFVDAASIKRTGSVVSFNYVLDVLAVAEGRSVPGGWKSNEVAATIDCSRNNFASSKLIAYTGPRATGSITGTFNFTAAEQAPEKIIPRATTAYLATHVCPNYKAR